MDEADREIEMEKDPFLAAGIDIPEELPYKEPSRKNSCVTSVVHSHKKLHQDIEELLLNNTPKKNDKDSSKDKNDLTEVTIDKSSLNGDIVKSSNFEENGLNHEMRVYPEISLELPTPTSSVPYSYEI